MADTLKDAAAKGAHGTDPKLTATVSAIIADVASGGAEAVRQYSSDFDGWSPDSFQLTPDEVERIVAGVDPNTRDDTHPMEGHPGRFRDDVDYRIKSIERMDSPRFELQLTSSRRRQ